jgi:hypothetical protein
MLSFILKNRSLFLIGAGVLLGIALIWWWSKKNKDFTPIEPTSLFKSIEYVEELRLATYYFEEMLILGTPQNVKKIRDDLEVEVHELEEDVQRKKFVADQGEKRLQEMESKIFSNEPELSEAEQKLSDLKRLLDAVPSGFNRIRRALESRPGFLGDSVAQAFLQLQVTQQAYEGEPWERFRGRKKREERRLWNDSLKRVEQQLEQAVERERDLRWNTWKRQEALTQRLQKNIDETEKALKKQRKEVEKALEKARDDLKEARKKLQNKAVELERAEAEFDRVTENQGDTIQPKLLVIAEAQVSGYINLKKLRISQGLFEDSLAVLLPEAEIDSVIFQLDSAQLYPLARPGSEKTEEGAYYDIFQQIKNAIIQAEGRVKKRAIEAGIKAETRRLAEDYVRDFAANLNLGVVFVDSIPHLGIDSTSQVLPFSADNVPDSLLNQLDTLQDSMVRSRSLLMEQGDQ